MKTGEIPSREVKEIVSKVWEQISQATGAILNSDMSKEEILDKFSYYKNLIQSKDSEISGYKSELGKLKDSVDILQRQNKELQVNLDDTIAKYDDFEPIYKERNALLSEKDISNDKIKFLSERSDLADNLQIEVSNLKNENSALNQKNTAFKSEIAALTKISNDFRIAQKEMSRKNVELNEKSKDIQKLKDEYAEAQSMIFTYRSKEKELVHALEVIKQLEAKISETEVDFKDKINVFENDKISLFNSKFSSEEALKEAKYVINAHEQTISDIMGKFILLEDEKSLFQSVNSELKGKLNDIENVLLQQSSALSKANDSISQYEQELSKAKLIAIDLDESHKLCNSLKANICKLEEEIAALKDNINGKSLSINELVNNNSSLQTHNEDLRNQISKLSKNIEEIEESNRLKENLIETQTREIIDSNNKMRIIQDKLGVFQTENIELAEEIEKYSILKNKFEILEDELIVCQKENDYLHEQKRLLNNEIITNNSKLKAIQIENEDLKTGYVDVKNQHTELQSYNSKLISKQADFEELSKQITMLSDINNDLRSEIDSKDIKINDLQGQIESLLSQNSDLLDSMKNSEDILFKVPSNERIEELKTNIARLEANLADRTKTSEKFQKQLESLKAKFVNTGEISLFPSEESIQLKKMEEKAKVMEKDIEDKLKEIEILKLKLECPQSLEHASSQEKIIMDLNSEKTLKELQIINVQRKNDALEEILRTRYEQIQILERELDEKVAEQNKYQQDKQKLIDKIESLILKLENCDIVLN